MSGDRWLPVPGFEGIHEVSELGQVRRIASGKGQLGIGSVNGRVDRSGYQQVNLRRPGTSKWIRVHRLVAAVFIGPCPPDQEVRHLDGDRLNNALPNLAYGTRSENMRDMVRHGRNSAAKTHCPAGHPYDESNTLHRDGKRFCLACRVERNINRRKR